MATLPGPLARPRGAQFTCLGVGIGWWFKCPCRRRRASSTVWWSFESCGLDIGAGARNDSGRAQFRGLRLGRSAPRCNGSEDLHGFAGHVGA